MQEYRGRIYLPQCRKCLGLIILCLTLTILDIIIVEIFYRPVCHTSEDWQIIWKWHFIYTLLIVTLPSLAAIKFRSLIPLGAWLFFIFGLEDTLFYSLQGYLPAQYYGVSIFGVWEPMLNFVLQINFLGLVTLLAFAFSGLDHYVTKKLLSIQRLHL
jgi:hypothetical protein